MNNPYEVLGVSANATDEQIKEAYKRLARKYHPDNYDDNPLADLAEEKMKEINEAYDTIMASRKTGGYGGSNGSFADVRNMISLGKLEEARVVLDGVPIASRNAEWYYLNGTLLYRKGWYEDAYTSFSNACRMDPSNMEYKTAFDGITNQRRGQFTGGYNMGRNTGGNCDTCDMCSTLICADCCCECMGGDLIACC